MNNLPNLVRYFRLGGVRLVAVGERLLDVWNYFLTRCAM